MRTHIQRPISPIAGGLRLIHKFFDGYLNSRKWNVSESSMDDHRHDRPSSFWTTRALHFDLISRTPPVGSPYNIQSHIKQILDTVFGVCHTRLSSNQQASLKNVNIWNQIQRNKFVYSTLEIFFISIPSSLTSCSKPTQQNWVRWSKIFTMQLALWNNDNNKMFDLNTNQFPSRFAWQHIFPFRDRSIRSALYACVCLYIEKHIDI